MSAEPESSVARLRRLAPDAQLRVLAGLSAAQSRELLERWEEWAHPGQVAPPGDWRVWLIRAGRGFGKTRAGAEWVSAFARDHPDGRIALVAATAEDAQRVMVEGVSGVIAVARADEAVTWHRSTGEVTFASGATAFVYSAERPDALRGPEHHIAWCDEVAKWRYGEAAWDNLLMGLRIGPHPQVLVTTTPRAVPLLRRIMALRDLVETRGRTRDNPHLPSAAVEALEASYAGTVLGRQELDGELIDDVTGALWSRAGIEACRVAVSPEVTRVVVAVDPPAGKTGDACGIVAVALGADGLGYVIEDASVEGATPEQWASAVVACAVRHDTEQVIAEANQGGAMIESVLRAVDADLPIRLVHAHKSKVRRAEPVAALYAAGRVKHVGGFPALEDQLCGMLVGGGYAGPGRSPDRADALVWALSELLLRGTGRASVRLLEG